MAAATAVEAADLRSGWLTGIAHVVSPNADARPAGAVASLLVIHNISLPPGRFGTGDVARLFTNTLDPQADPFYPAIAGVRVSAHFLIARSGDVTQFVPTEQRAWHAGVSSFEGRERCNDFSIGIELEGTDELPFTDAQYAALAGLCKRLLACHPIDALAGHSDIAPGRKTDPGPCFDWQRLRDALALPPAFFPFQPTPAGPV
ncbi:1,6-anhydro-N-acetylmuramyl-L-alanine amidase AmpD [Chitinasiproducens palmae]|uniref:1,6-anhydro-N-acetylmuramyl-L-alanine amidase AmpD n=1 Tax=Chitinasiproducens palmae TaxID=1770053 RepID=UPI0038B40610